MTHPADWYPDPGLFGGPVLVVDQQARILELNNRDSVYDQQAAPAIR